MSMIGTPERGSTDSYAQWKAPDTSKRAPQVDRHPWNDASTDALQSARERVQGQIQGNTDERKRSIFGENAPLLKQEGDRLQQELGTLERILEKRGVLVRSEKPKPRAEEGVNEYLGMRRDDLVRIEQQSEEDRRRWRELRSDPNFNAQDGIDRAESELKKVREALREAA